MSRTLLRSLVVLATTVFALAFAASAVAGPVSPYMAVWVSSSTATTATVCGFGSVDDGAYLTGVWTLTVTGVRADGLPIAGAAPVANGPTWGACVTVVTGALASTFNGVATFMGAGTADVTGSAGVVVVRTAATGLVPTHYTTSG